MKVRVTGRKHPNSPPSPQESDMRLTPIILSAMLAGCGPAAYPNGPLTRAQTIAAIKQCNDAGLHATQIKSVYGGVLDVVCDQKKGE
jgi:hypothetical protein